MGRNLYCMWLIKSNFKTIALHTNFYKNCCFTIINYHAPGAIPAQKSGTNLVIKTKDKKKNHVQLLYPWLIFCTRLNTKFYSELK